MSELPELGSHWMATAPSAPYPAADTDLEVDTAVVGGGMAGLSTAWELARAGRSVAVLEAGRIAAGVTGNTTAKLSALHTVTYDRLRRTRGAEAARLYARSQMDAVERAAEIVDELGVDCEWERVPAFTYVDDTARVGEIEAEADAAAEAGLPAEFVSGEGTGLPFPVAGAVRVPDQAQFHPRKYLLALAADLTARGGRIYERTRVTGLTEGEPCRLTTKEGTTVTARDVVVATHYPVFDRALLFTRLSPRRELAIAAPVPTDRDPGGMYITSEHRIRSVRTAPYGEGQRLLIVTGESFTPGTGDSAERLRRLAGWAREHFPGIELSHRWAAQDNDPTDTVPLVGRFHPGSRHTYVATGFGGWGISGGVVASRLITALIAGDGPPWAGLYDPRRLVSAAREAPSFVRHQADVGRHFVGDRLTTAHTGSAAELAPGSGAVLRVNGSRRAVYRDEEGRLHSVSARCTHLGCLVGFNHAERTWECPCHGSRFGVDGSVLQGPATAPLRRYEP